MYQKCLAGLGLSLLALLSFSFTGTVVADAAKPASVAAVRSWSPANAVPIYEGCSGIFVVN